MSMAKSPFSPKVDSFFVPSPSETHEIRALITDSSTELAKIDAELAEMEAALVNLRTQRDALYKNILAHQSVLSPIRRLPSDVLVEIFSACLPTKHYPLIHPSQPPLLFGRVCRYWRDLSRATPLLWKKVHIRGLHDMHMRVANDFGEPSLLARNAPAPDRTILNRFLETLDRWLDDAGSCALSVAYIQQREDRNPQGIYPDSESLAILDRILAARTRIAQFSVDGDSPELARMLGLAEGEMPALKGLALYLQGSTQPDHWLEKLPILRNAKLDKLCLSGFASPLQLPVVWSHLRVLSLVCYHASLDVSAAQTTIQSTGLDQNMIHEILSLCPSLVRAAFGITLWRERRPVPPLVMHNLEHLALTLGYPLATDEPTPDVARLLESLIMPKLSLFELGRFVEKFELGNADDYPTLTEPQDELAVYLHPKLGQSGATLLLILAQLPRMTALHLAPYGASSKMTSRDWMPPLDAHLFLGLEDPDLCPLLRDLHIVLPSVHMRDTGVLECVRARRPALVSLHLEARSSQSIDIEEELKGLEREGLALRVDYEAEVPRWRYDILRDMDS
ncbi:F-box domain-containing protein [Mycena chlorophos]|uniref:F-box domain-containing protein n=1 Tax=Mycena chlorophos TaxID=658473 RepID=A0A8H6SST4_MYCCL|nr:F-box domain-containing protein [Mycena chlorophos]